MVDLVGLRAECDGSSDCRAETHLHGCFAERPFGSAVDGKRSPVVGLRGEGDARQYPQEQKLDRATIRRWRSEAVTASAQDRLWLNRCEALANALLRGEIPRG